MIILIIFDLKLNFETEQIEIDLVSKFISFSTWYAVRHFAIQQRRSSNSNFVKCSLGRDKVMILGPSPCRRWGKLP